MINGEFQTAQRLLYSGADTTLKDHDHWAPIHWAAYKGDRDMVELLLEYPLPKRESASTRLSRDERDYSPLFLAAEVGNSRIVDDLLHFYNWAPPQQADIPVESSFRERSKDDPLARSSSIRRGKLSASLLHEAIQSEQLALLKLLVERGAGLGPLMSERDRRTPLHTAVFCQDCRIPQFLLPSGADMSIRDKNGLSPLDLASSRGNFPLLKSLLQQPSQGAVKGGHTSPLHLIWRSKISYEQQVEIADMLLSLGVDINQLDYHGFTPFQYALTRGRFDAIDWFTIHGIDVNAYEGKQKPALHCTITTMD